MHETFETTEPGRIPTETGQRLPSEGAALEARCREARDWPGVIEHLLSRAEQSRDRAKCFQLLSEAARVYEQELGDPESAFLVLQAAHRKRFTDAGLAELERLAEATGEWAQLADVVTEAAHKREAQAPREAAALWLRVSRWLRERLGDLGEAAEALRRAVSLDPESREALRALVAVLEERGAWHDAVDALRALARLETDKELRLEIFLALGDVSETRLGQRPRAIAAYRAALEQAPDCMDALVSLARLYRVEQDWVQLIDVLALTSGLRRRRGDLDEVVRLETEIADVYRDHLGDADRAISHYRAALAEDPGDVAALLALEELYEQAGRAEEYLEILEAELDLLPEEERPLSRYERMASVWEAQMQRPDRAAACLEKVIAADVGNYDAHRRLVSLYRRAEDWAALAAAYRGFIDASWNPEIKSALCREMAEVFERHLRDPDGAAAAYRELLESAPGDVQALEALVRLYEGASSWDRAIECLERLAETGQSGLEPAELRSRIGRLKRAQGDARGAEACFLEALELNPLCVSAMTELGAVYAERGAWKAAADMMTRAAPQMKFAPETGRMLYQGARIHLDRLGDGGRAAELLAEALKFDPEHVEAAWTLAQLYFRTEQWEPLAPLLDMLLRRATREGRFERGELKRIYALAGRCADALGDLEKASSLYRSAHELDSSDVEVARSFADLAYRTGDLETARALYEQLARAGRELERGDRIALGCRLGAIYQALGDHGRALGIFERALIVDPSHTESLTRMVEIHRARGDRRAEVEAKRKLSEVVGERERAILLVEIGDTFRDELRAPREAIAAYRQASAILPDDHRLLQKLLDLYSETGQWAEVLGVIDKFLAVEEDPVRRSFYYRTAGTICRRELQDEDKALGYYEAALDAFFSSTGPVAAPTRRRALEAFAKIDEILTARRDWRGQERAYRKMIRRLRPGDAEIGAELWHSLGEIYRSRLGDYREAIQAFERAQELCPESAQRKSILAELYVACGADQADKAVAQHAALLQSEPYRFESYKALRRIYTETGQVDKAWCVASALALLERAEPEDLELCERFAASGRKVAKQPLGEEHWRKIAHPDADPLVSAIMRCVRPVVAEMKAAPHKAFGLRRGDRLDLRKDGRPVSRQLLYAADVLGLSRPEVYLQTGERGDIALASCMHRGELTPAFVLRRDILKKESAGELSFQAAQKLALLRSEHYLKLALPTATELRAAFFAAVALAKPSLQVPPEMQELVSQFLPEMQARISLRTHGQLEALVDELAGRDAQVDLARWGHGVDATAYRAGFIVCDRLQTACRMLALEPPVVGAPTAKEKIKDLILYAVSEDYFAVRKHLGLSVS